jgi:hypothetical protein
MYSRISIILLLLALASCQAAQSPPAPAASAAPVVPSPAVPLSPLGSTSFVDQTTTRLLIFHWDLVRAFPEISASPLRAAGVSLSIDPAAHVLIVSGPPSAVTAACDLFTFLDGGYLSSQVRALKYANPVELAATLNKVFGTADKRIAPPLIGRFYAMPTSDSLVLFAFPDTIREANSVVDSLDVDPKSLATFDPNLKVPLELDNTPLTVILEHYSKSYGTLFIHQLPPAQHVTLNVPLPMNEQAALSLLSDILYPLDFTIISQVTTTSHPKRTIVRIVTDYSDRRTPDVVIGTDPKNTPPTSGAAIQIIPLKHATPASIANFARPRMYGFTDFYIQTDTNSLAIMGNAEDIHDLLLILPQLDK